MCVLCVCPAFVIGCLMSEDPLENKTVHCCFSNCDDVRMMKKLPLTRLDCI